MLSKEEEYRSQLEAIKIDGLFGEFSYEISLARPRHATIIFGRNGTGKTTILRLLHAVSICDLDYLSSLPFLGIEMKFTSGCMKIEKSEDLHQAWKKRLPSGRPSALLKFKYAPNDKKKFLEDWGQVFEVAPVQWVFTNLDLYFVYLHIIQLQGPLNILFSDEPQLNLARYPQEQAQNDISDSDAASSILNVLSQANQIGRLVDELGLRTFYIPSRRLIMPSNGEKPIVSVINHSRRLEEMIHSAYGSYSKEAERRSRTYPHRVVDDSAWEPEEDRMAAQLLQEVNSVEARRNQLVSLGVLPKSMEYSPIDVENLLDYLELPEFASFLISFLRNYKMDEEAKMLHIGDLAGRIEAFLNFFNKTLRNRKKLSIRKGIIEEDGTISASDYGAFLVESGTTGNAIPLVKLSNGEQHLINWSYQLLFLCSNADLVLIDEPELSMHIDWQLEFIQAIERLVQGNQTHFILATHSPGIVKERWNLAVTLDDLDKGVRGTMKPHLEREEG